MTLDEARDELRMLCGGKSDPYLTDPELDRILQRARRVDAAGVAVGADGYVSTWDLTWAAVQAWEVKAGKASEYTSANVGGGTIPAEQIYEHCKRQADTFRRGLNSAVPFELPAET